MTVSKEHNRKRATRLCILENNFEIVKTWEYGPAPDPMKRFDDEVFEVSHECDLNRSAVRTIRNLEAANENLEQFASTCSHDLKEPLRTISVHLQLLSEKACDNEAREFIQHCLAGAKQMSTLIDDLLKLALLRGKPVLKKVDCQQILSETVLGMSQKIKENGAKISFNALPFVMGEETQIRQLFENLIGNAIKYRRADPLEVNVTAEKIKTQWQFAIKDNGIGFDMKYAEKIFKTFERLHSKDKYSGTGIGLGICKKILENHGGKIWAKSALGKGATFCFTLPVVA